MTKKYEKFEDWMVGKKISVGGYEGVVLGRYFPSIVASEAVCIEYKIGDNPTDWKWVELENVTFLEEVAHEEGTSPIPWEVGQVVWDVVYGKGVVSCVEEGAIFPVKVEFDDEGNESFTLQGSFYEVGTRTLFFSEPTIIADTMPPEKPFVPKLKEGDKVLIKDKQGIIREGTVKVVHKESDDRIYVSKDGDYFMKYDIASLQIIGEEIKFEEN